MGGLHGPIKDPVGWLIGRGLPQRQLCAEPRCDEGALLDSGQGCPRCEDRQADARDRRRTVAAPVDAAMPDASRAERRTATDRQVQETVTAQGWAKVRRWEQVRERQTADAQARAHAAEPTDDTVRPRRAPRWSCYPRRARGASSSSRRSPTSRSSTSTRSSSGRS
ncbi:hypothetical protein GCM10010278_80450 [Streptomyces melanogenes]|nr:hypothetical protein GCM10010278_80450 [Streptomyces melanogenes]